MNRCDGNRNRKEQQIGDQPGTPLVRCLVLVAKILNLRKTKKNSRRQHRGRAGRGATQHAAQGGRRRRHARQIRKKGPSAGGTDFWAQRK